MGVMINLRDHIRGIPDFPKPGILFYDIAPLLAHAQAWRTAVGHLAETLRPERPDLLVGIDARGFLLAAPLALALDVGFVMVRKPGKLPGKTIDYDYRLEYGTGTVAIQEGALKPGQRVVILDDLLATGGTAQAAIKLCRQLGADVRRAAFIIELTPLQGRARLDAPVTSLIQYDS